MPIAERLGARSRCFVAPVGADPNDKSVWTEIGSVDGDALTLEKAAHSYSWPTRYLIGAPPGTYEVQFSTMSLSQELLDLYYGKTVTINERSKPMGLTKEHEYTDNDGDKLTVEVYDAEGHIGHIASAEYGTYIRVADSVPLALNMLGHDRPELGERRFPDDAQSYSPVVRSDAHRDGLLADAVANLRAIDLYDQHLVKKKADEEAAAEAARVEVELAAREAKRAEGVRERDAAREQLHHWARNLGRVGINGTNLGALKKTIGEYEAAQLKLSGRV